MNDKLKARPKYNRTEKKWNIEVEKEGNFYPLGTSIGELFFKRTEFDTKKDAIEYIENSDGLEAESKESNIPIIPTVGNENELSKFPNELLEALE